MSKWTEKDDLLEQQVEFRFLVSMGEGLPEVEKGKLQASYWERVILRVRKLSDEHPLRRLPRSPGPRWEFSLDGQLREPVMTMFLPWWCLTFKAARHFRDEDIEALAALCKQAGTEELPGENNSITPGAVLITERRMITTIETYKG